MFLKAERRATNVHMSPTQARAFQKVADRILKVSSSNVGQDLEVMLSTGSLLVQKKARSAMRLIVYKAYDEELGRVGNSYFMARKCQEAIKTALDVIGLPEPTVEQRTRICKKRMFVAQSKLKIEKAVNSALIEVQKSKVNFPEGQKCGSFKENAQQLAIAKIEVDAVTKACPDINANTEGAGKRQLRQQIRDDISKYMSKHLKEVEVNFGKSEGKETDKVKEQAQNLIAAARHAWTDVANFASGARVQVNDAYPAVHVPFEKPEDADTDNTPPAPTAAPTPAAPTMAPTHPHLLEILRNRTKAKQTEQNASP